MSKFRKIILGTALLGILAHSSAILADDTDIYSKPASSTAASNPNIIIILDNSANWAEAAQGWQPTAECPAPCKQGQAELNAVRSIAAELTEKVNVGLMMFTKGSGANKNGGYVRFDIRPMSPVNKDAFAEMIGYSSGCTAGVNSLNGTPNCIFQNFNGSEKVDAASTDYSAAMFEVFKYFGGYTSPANARNDTAGAPIDTSHFGPTRYAGDPDPKTDRYAFTPITDLNLTTYDPPIKGTESCSKNYVIFIGNGFPSQDSPSTLLSEVGGDTTQLPLNDFTKTGSVTVSVTESLPTTNCGKYADIASCVADVSSVYSNPPYSLDYHTYKCALAKTCPPGTVNDQLFDPSDGLSSPSICFSFSNATACQDALSAKYAPAYTSYTCTVGNVCEGWAKTVIGVDNLVTADTGCIKKIGGGPACQNYGATILPLNKFKDFSCIELPTACAANNESRYKITATSIFKQGTQYNMWGTRVTSAESYSHTITGTASRTIDTIVPTGTFSLPGAPNTNYADEWARFLNRTDVSSVPGFQNITTYTIDVFKDKPSADQSALLMSMARAGGGKYYTASNEDAIKNALRRIVSEIQAVNSVFASSSLPVSVNTQGTYLNQVFMGMFRPDSTAAPRWAGNLKQYKFKIFNGVLRLSDSRGQEAISASTGFITPCAASFWSSDSGTYWDFPSAFALGDCTAITSDFPTPGSPSLFSDYPDGEVVEKGGAAQHLRGVLSSGGTLTSSSVRYSVCTGTDTPETAACRKMFTCDGSSTTSCTSLTNFDANNTAVTDAIGLLIPVASEAGTLVNWLRGEDVDNENENFDNTDPLNPVAFVNEVRPSVHGGVVHAQPAVIDYGGSTGVIAFYGSDDGVFHAIKGNQDVTDGTELWSFVAPEHYSLLHRLRDNGNSTPRIDFLGTVGSVAPKEYGFDGGIGVYQKGLVLDADGVTVVYPSQVWIFPAMRRGGRGIYAFDVSSPRNPILKWRKGCFSADDSMCSTDWAGIGQTWSQPIVAHLKGYANPVLIFGGGYDTCEDTNAKSRCGATPPTPPATRPKGANIWFVDATTGKIIRTYSTNYSVPGDLTLMKDKDGFVTHVYASDTGGYVYRVNVGTWDGGGTFAGNWSVDNTTINVNSPAGIAIASLSGVTSVRKFLSGPAVVSYAAFNAVLLGSGDREHPLIGDYACDNYSGNGVTNRFYMLIDIPNNYLTAATNTELVDVTAGTTTFDSATHTITNNTGGTVTTSTRGWRFDLGTCEQSVNKGLVIAGTTFFGTNAPGASSSACVANLGNAKGYAVEFLTGNPINNAPRSAAYTGGGMPPSPVAGVVDVDGLKLPFCIGCIDPAASNASALEGTEITINPTGSRFRSYWYIENDFD